MKITQSTKTYEAGVICAGKVVWHYGETYLITDLWWSPNLGSIKKTKDINHDKRLTINLATGESNSLFSTDLVLVLDAELVIK